MDNYLYLQRKTPRQQRAKSMVESILQASIRILKQEPEPRFTTSRVAEVAGISVGSLYQYFPNKQSIVGALIRKHASESVKLMKSNLLSQQPQNLEETVDVLVDFAVDYHMERKLVYKFMFRFLHLVDGFQHVNQARRDAADIINEFCEQNQITSSHSHEQRRQAIFMSLQAVMGVVDYALVYDDKAICPEDLKSEAKLLVKGYF